MEGKMEGKIEAFRDMASKQLDARFGPLTPAVQQRVNELGIEQLQELLVQIVKVTTLKELHLED
jgi:hypothetical protein